jgi:predicted RNA polymerase sigma factor
MGTADVEAVWRVESARIVAALTRFTGDFGLAEDAAQDAVAEALVSWPLACPANPAGWLMATARRRAIDAIRRRTALHDRYALLAADPAVDEEIDPDRIDDDVGDQDRRLWDGPAIRRGLAALAEASTRGLGRYGLQAAIAATHASAPSVEETDWDRIVLLYGALGRVAPSPVVELNRAVAVAMASGPAQALAIVDGLIAADRLPGSHLVPTVRAELLTRLGRRPEARAELELAARLCANQRERSVLLGRAAALG